MLHFFSVRRLAGVLFLAVFPLSMAAATDVTLQGAFFADDNLALFSIQVAAPSEVTIQTLSYAGGTAVNGDVIDRGGFDPVLSLFTGYLNPAGELIAVNEDGGCGQVGMDSVTGNCWDAAIRLNLMPGIYTLVLSQYSNNAVGPTFSDGFTRAGAGNYIGMETVGINTPFWDLTPTKRDGRWALTFLNVNSAAEAPEPATFSIIGIGLGALAILRSRT